MNNIYKPTDENISKAAEIIKNGGLVGMPTETVYGLGANVYDSKAIAKIFEAKNRPSFNPLISHIAEFELLKEFAQTDERAIELAKKFWPGPLTFVLNRIDNNQSLDFVCAGLKTITVRMPNHPVALELIKKSGVPIAAPSANLSTTISPTTAMHVYQSLGNKVDMILDGGACQVGLESTIIDLTTKETTILRAGFVGLKEIEEALGEKVYISSGNPDKPSAPGQMLKHYSPKKETRINVCKPNDDEFYIGFGKHDSKHLNLSKSGDLIESASNLFAYMHMADEQKQYSKIAIAPIPNIGIGIAINDRIIKASHKG